MYVKVPIINHELDIDYEYMREGYSFSENEAVIWMRDEAPVRDSWQILTEMVYLSYFGAGVVTTNKNTIVADGVDEAIVTVSADASLTEVTFYNATTSEVITTQPVDLVSHKATLHVTATTPGTIRIRVGLETMTRLNEVIINAT